MRLIAWLYLNAPLWATRLLPDNINNADDGKFYDAVAQVYNWQCERYNRKIRRHS